MVIYPMDSAILQCLNKVDLPNNSGMLFFAGKKLNRREKTKVQPATVISLRSFALVS